MRVSLLAALFVVLVVCNASAQFQEPTAPLFQQKWWVRINGQAAIPSSPDAFKDQYHSGFGGGIGAALTMSEWITVSADFDYNFYRINKSSFGSDQNPVTVDGGNGSAYYLWVGARGNLVYVEEGDRVVPYLTAGLGLFDIHFDSVTISDPNVLPGVQAGDNTALGISGGAGIDFEIRPKVHSFLEFLAVVGFTSDKNTIYFPFRVGLSYQVR